MITGFKTKTIKHKSLGEKIRSARIKQEKRLHEAEEATKVRERYLQAFEKDDFESMPDQVYAIGFFSRYIDWLGLPQEKFIEEFKRSWNAWESMRRHTLRLESTVEEPKVIITPKIILSTLTGLVVFAIVGYIWFQVRHLTAPPELFIVNPTHATKVAIEKIEISGKTDPGAVVAINNQIVTQDLEGNFKELVALETGVNTIQVVATNRFQKQKSQVLTIIKTQEGAVPQAEDTSAEVQKGISNG